MFWCRQLSARRGWGKSGAVDRPGLASASFISLFLQRFRNEEGVHSAASIPRTAPASLRSPVVLAMVTRPPLLSPACGVESQCSLRMVVDRWLGTGSGKKLLRFAPALTTGLT